MHVERCSARSTTTLYGAAGAKTGPPALGAFPEHLAHTVDASEPVYIFCACNTAPAPAPASTPIALGSTALATTLAATLATPLSVPGICDLEKYTTRSAHTLRAHAMSRQPRRNLAPHSL